MVSHSRTRTHQLSTSHLAPASTHEAWPVTPPGGPAANDNENSAATLARWTLLPLEPESSRVVLIESADGERRGAGCLVSSERILTCTHVVRDVLGPTHSSLAVGDVIPVVLVGVSGQPRVQAMLEYLGDPSSFASDIAVLRLEEHASARLAIAPVRFAAPMTHAGKRFGVLGFPGGINYGRTGRHAAGLLRGADAEGLVQMDGDHIIAVEPGYSGAPVWCADVQAFVGIVVAAEKDAGLSWLVPARLLAACCPGLEVRFRVPKPDRPEIHDWELDDPNIDLFGTSSESAGRCLTATITKQKRYFTVRVRYQHRGGAPARGGSVTFITYPDFCVEHEDAYELFALLKDGIASQEIYPTDLFTIAAIGDAGDTALTLNLAALWEGRAGGAEPDHDRQPKAKRAKSRRPQSKR